MKRRKALEKIGLGVAAGLTADSIWSKVIDQLNIPTVNFSAEATDNFILDNTYKRGTVLTGDGDFLTAKNFLNNIRNYSGGNVSVQQAIQTAGISPRMHAILNSWIGNKSGTANSRVSATAIGSALNLRPARYCRKNTSQQFNAGCSRLTFQQRSSPR